MSLAKEFDLMRIYLVREYFEMTKNIIIEKIKRNNLTRSSLDVEIATVRVTVEGSFFQHEELSFTWLKHPKQHTVHFVESMGKRMLKRKKIP